MTARKSSTNPRQADGAKRHPAHAPHYDTRDRIAPIPSLGRQVADAVDPGVDMHGAFLIAFRFPSAPGAATLGKLGSGDGSTVLIIAFTTRILGRRIERKQSVPLRPCHAVDRKKAVIGGDQHGRHTLNGPPVSTEMVTESPGLRRPIEETTSLTSGSPDNRVVKGAVSPSSASTASSVLAGSPAVNSCTPSR